MIVWWILKCRPLAILLSVSAKHTTNHPYPRHVATPHTIRTVAPTAVNNEIIMANKDLLLNKHILARLRHAEVMAHVSPCTRGKVGAVVFDPTSYAIIADGYNGPPRKGGALCGGRACTRTEFGIESGTRCEVGCHHAEMNAILNAARLGHPTLGAAIVITCEPCLMCAKMMHHAGIVSVYYLEGGYSSAGIRYLEVNAIDHAEL